MFLDVRKEIIASLSSGDLQQDLYRLEDFVFQSICVPSFTNGHLFRIVVPHDVRWNGSSETVARVDMHCKTLKKDEKRTYLLTKDRWLVLGIGAKFNAEYF